MKTESDKLREAPYATRELSLKQLDLFESHDWEHLPNYSSAELERALSDLIESRSLIKLSAQEQTRNVFLSFNIYPSGLSDRHLAKAGYPESPAVAIESDWVSVFEDVCVAFLSEASKLERQSER